MTWLFKLGTFNCKNRDLLNLSQEKWSLLERSSGLEPDLKASGNKAGLGVSVSFHSYLILHILFVVLVPTRFITNFLGLNIPRYRRSMTVLRLQTKYYICVCVCVCVCVYMYLCVCVMYIYTCIYIYTYTQVYICMFL